MFLYSVDNPTCRSSTESQGWRGGSHFGKKTIGEVHWKCYYYRPEKFTIYFTSGKDFDSLYCRLGCLKENIKLEKHKTGKFKYFTPPSADKLGSLKENIKKKVRNWKKKLLQTVQTGLINQINQTSLTAIYFYSKCT